ncbi:MAG TPA: hypothetical protein VGP93_07960 [Polyangiaceae bacterium]|nr:hypothetical protein [Polyangiaceae bacterium]
MHQSVLDAFVPFTKPMEGCVPHLYCDVLGLITTGIGNLVDPVSLALQLPWKLPDGSLASETEIRAQWRALKNQCDRLKHLHYAYAGKVTTMRLTDADIAELVEGKLLENERFMRKALPDWDEFPADAQLGCCSMAWAVGPAFTAKFSNFTKFANKQDWISAKACCTIRTAGNPGIIPRNRANELCFENAATVVEFSLDRSVLHWPNAAKQEAVAPSPANETFTAAEKARIAELQVDVVGTLRADAMKELSGFDSDPGADTERPPPEPERNS